MTKSYFTIDPKVRDLFETVKTVKTVKDPDTLDYAIYQINNKEIVPDSEGGKYEEWKDFVAQFKDDTPRYAVVKFKYQVQGEQRHKIVLVTWVPEEAKPHARELYTWNKDHLYKELGDINLSVMAHTTKDLDYATILPQFKAL